MAFFGKYISCPLDQSHQILHTRIQTHLYKCKKNFPKDVKVNCLFNPTHLLNPDEFEHHLSICPNSKTVRCFQQTFEPDTKIGIVTIEEAESACSSVSAEDWSGEFVTYDPVKASEAKEVIRPGIALSKARKKKHRTLERERLSKIKSENTYEYSNDNNTTICSYEESETPLRIPKSIPKGLKIRRDSSSDNSDSNAFTTKDLSIKLMHCSINSESSDTVSDTNTDNDTCTKKELEEVENVTKKNYNKNKSNERSNSLPRNDNNNIKKVGEMKTQPLRISRELLTNIGRAKKISTGRGFTYAYEQIKNEILQQQGKDTSLKELNNMFDCDEEEGDTVK